MGLEDKFGKIPLRRVFKPFIEALFDTTDGHDHDGINSKALSPSAVVANDSVSTAKIQDAAVVADKIAANAVTAVKILDGAVTGGKIPAQTITTDHLADTNVTAAKIGTGAVTAAKIGTGAVTASKIGTDAVVEAKIQNGAVTADKLAADAVITTKILDANVTADKLAAGAITHAKIDTGAVIESKLGTGAVTADKIGANAVTAAKLNADVAGDGLALNGGTNALEVNVDESTIETNSDTLRVKALGIDTAQLADDAVTNDKLANISQGSIKVGGAADAPTDLDASGDAKILVGDGTDLKSVAVSGDITLANTGKATITGVESTEFEVAEGSAANRIKLVSNADTADAKLTITSAALDGDKTATFQNASGTVAYTSDILLKEVRDVPVSFEDGETVQLKVYFPYAVTVDKIRAFATKAIAATDDATITCGNETGASDSGVITFTAEDPVGTEKAVEPATNAVVGAGEFYYLTTAKTTPGGRALVSIEVTRTA